MTNIFSQVINKDGLDYTYNCSVDDDMIVFSYTILHDKRNLEVISNMVIDFPTLRSFSNDNLNTFESNEFIILNDSNYYKIYSKKEKEKILLPKQFLIDAYNILKSMWVDDE